MLDDRCSITVLEFGIKRPCRGRSLIAQAFKPGFKGSLFEQRWLGIVIRRGIVLPARWKRDDGLVQLLEKQDSGTKVLHQQDVLQSGLKIL